MIQAVLCLFHLTSPPQPGFEIASSLGFGNPLVASLCLSPLIKKKKKDLFLLTWGYVCLCTCACSFHRGRKRSHQAWLLGTRLRSATERGLALNC